jgi:hypothetical protein
MTDDVPEHPRSPRPVRGTAGLHGFITQADNFSAAGDGMRVDGAERAMPSTSATPTTGASPSASFAQPRKKAKVSKDRPSVLLHLMESQSNIQLSG